MATLRNPQEIQSKGICCLICRWIQRNWHPWCRTRNGTLSSQPEQPISTADNSTHAAPSVPSSCFMQDRCLKTSCSHKVSHFVGCSSSALWSFPLRVKKAQSYHSRKDSFDLRSMRWNTLTSKKPRSLFSPIKAQTLKTFEYLSPCLSAFHPLSRNNCVSSPNRSIMKMNYFPHTA